MPKLSVEQRRELKEMLRSRVTNQSMMKKFNLSARQFQRYRREIDAEMGIKEPLSSPARPTATTAPSPPQPTTEPTQPVQPAQPVEPDDLKKGDLIDPPSAMHPDKNYCGACHQRGHLTEIAQGQETCPVCGIALEW